MVKFKPPEWKPLSPDFEKNTDNGANCPKCGKRAAQVKTEQRSEYHGTQITYTLQCGQCGQYWQCWTYVTSD
jgi:transcription elongation factor Elf1